MNCSDEEDEKQKTKSNDDNDNGVLESLKKFEFKFGEKSTPDEVSKFLLELLYILNECKIPRRCQINSFVLKDG